MRTEFLCISILRVASGPRVKLASCKSDLNLRRFTLLTVLRRWSIANTSLGEERADLSAFLTFI